MNISFGQFIVDKRKTLGLTLREFSRDKGIDASYVSRLENSLLLPPSSVEKLRALAKALEINENTEDWVEFFDLAAIARRELPKDIDGTNSNIGALPAFYRALRKDKVTEQDVEEIKKALSVQDADDEDEGDEEG